MKYFCQTYLSGRDRIYHLSSEAALRTYTNWFKLKLTDKDPNISYEAGAKISLDKLRLILWGEDISDKECFKRRLAGKLEILEPTEFGR